MARPKKTPATPVVIASQAITKIKTETPKDIRQVCQAIGDSLTDTYFTTKDLKAALAAIGAYNIAINVVKAQLINKKLTGHPAKIEFFED